MDLDTSILKNKELYYLADNLFQEEEILKDFKLINYEENKNGNKFDLIITIEIENTEVNNLSIIHSILREKLVEGNIINLQIRINLFRCIIRGTIEEISYKINFAEECDICVNADNILNNEIESSCQISDTNFKKCKFDKIYIKKSSHNYIIFKSNGNKVENLRIENIDNSEQCKFILEKVGLKLLSIKDSTFSDDFLMKNNFEQDTMFFIEDSTFEKNFFYMRCNSIKNFYLKNVIFNGNVNFSHTGVKDIHLEEVYFDESKTVDFTNFTILYSKEIYSTTFRKIKLFLEKIGNKIEANKYHSYEMKARKFELKYKGTIEEKIVFFLNDNISNHGLSWLQTLFWILIIGFFYSGTFMSLNDSRVALENHIVLLISISIFTYFSATFIVNMKENHSEEAIKRFNSWQLGLIFYTINFIRFCIPMICAFYFYYNINELDIKPFFKFINVIDFSESNITYEVKTVSKLIMIYLIYHFVFALRKDTKK